MPLLFFLCSSRQMTGFTRSTRVSDGSSRPSLRLAFHCSDYTRSCVHLLGPFITFQPHSAQLPSYFPRRSSSAVQISKVFWSYHTAGFRFLQTKKAFCCLAEHFCAKLPTPTTAFRSVVFYSIRVSWEKQEIDNGEPFQDHRRRQLYIQQKPVKQSFTGFWYAGRDSNPRPTGS